MKLLITEKQLKRLSNTLLEQKADKERKMELKVVARNNKDMELSSEVTSHPYYKMFMKKLSDTGELRFKNASLRYLLEDLTLDDTERIAILDRFAELLNKGGKPKKKYRKIKYISINGKNMEPEIVGDDIEDEIPTPCPTIEFTIDAIAEGPYKPFENNSYKLGKGLKDDISVLIDDIKGVQNDFNDKIKIKVVKFDVKTSANRMLNGGAYKGKSFLKLSEDRAKNVVNYITNALQNIGVEVISPTVDFKAVNGDGSSGPNPPAPSSLAKDEGENQTIDNTQDRNLFGSPLSSIREYDQFKYCKVELIVSGKVEEEKPDEGEVGGSEESKETPQEWKVYLGMKRGIQIKWPDWKIRFRKRYKNPRRKKIKSKHKTACWYG
tara:strand:- start:4879 stop:6018 length:1140 start_codon:yes stop_codon:yes gene_type:complete